MLTKSLTYAGLASVASAHIVMTNPPMFPLQGVDANAPLYGASGAPFPCGTTSFTGVQSTMWKAGSVENIKFKGTAVHGGGSCQISVTTDLNPTEKSVWKVIKSIHGGCPARNQPGNIDPANAELPLPEGYDVEVPDLPTGSYTLAWTWFNKVGNREMYMNCAPIEITGGSGSVDPSSLPDMMVANIPQSSCKTLETFDIEFPNPGENVVKYGSGPYGPPSGDCGSVGAAPQPVDEKPAEVPVGNTTPVENTTPPPPPPPPSGSCTPGYFKCIDGKTYSQCAPSGWSVAMPVAPGTSCTVGEGPTLNVAAM